MRLFVAACGWLDTNKLKKIREAYFYDTVLGVNFCAKKDATHVVCDTLDGTVAMGKSYANPTLYARRSWISFKGCMQYVGTYM
jgi:hypothetical protein